MIVWGIVLVCNWYGCYEPEEEKEEEPYAWIEPCAEPEPEPEIDE